MQEELLAYYPEISKDKIRITGSPQFDFYFQKGIILDREVIAEKFGLDAAKTWVCFSGSDSVTSPNDPLFLRDVASSLGNIEDIQLIFRPVPVEKVDRFSPVLEDFPAVKLIQPIWVTGAHWGSFFPLFEDVQLLVNLAYHCKVVVNMGSTMALDFSTFGNIGLYLRYDHPNVSAESSVKTIFQFQHFRSMGEWKAVGYIDAPSEIASMVKQALQNPEEVAPDRMRWFNKIVAPEIEKKASSRIVEAITER